MKYLPILLAFVALAAGHEFAEIVAAKDRSISSGLVDFLEALKLDMPCGWPTYGIPPLAPLKTAHQAFNVDGESVGMEGEVNKVRVWGLDNYEIIEMNVNVLRSTVTFNINWSNIFCTTLYDMKARLDVYGTELHTSGNGNAHLSLKNFKATGTIKYSLGVISNQLKLKEVKVYTTLGSVESNIENLSSVAIINQKINEIIEQWFMMTVNENTNNVAELSNTLVVPLVNSLIEGMSWKDLVGLATGGGGEGEKEPCVPPPIDP